MEAQKCSSSASVPKETSNSSLLSGLPTDPLLIQVFVDVSPALDPMLRTHCCRSFTASNFTPYRTSKHHRAFNAHAVLIVVVRRAFCLDRSARFLYGWLSLHGGPRVSQCVHPPTSVRRVVEQTDGPIIVQALCPQRIITSIQLSNAPLRKHCT